MKCLLRLLMIVMGLISITIGASILVWCVYSFLVPNEHFQFHWIQTPALMLPIVMIWAGWKWLRSSKEAAPKYSCELTLTLKLAKTEAGFGTPQEREAILDLRHRLEAALQENNLGEVDGDEFGDNECTLFIETDNPLKATESIQSFLAAEPRSWNYTLQHETSSSEH